MTQDPAILRKQTKLLALLACALSICSALLFLFSLLDLGCVWTRMSVSGHLLTSVMLCRSVSMYCLPPSAAFSAIYYSVSFLKMRGLHPRLRLLTSGFALTLPWILFIVDLAGIVFVSIMISMVGMRRPYTGTFVGFWTVMGVGNAGTVVTELALAVVHVILLIAVSRRGGITRLCAKVVEEEEMQPIEGDRSGTTRTDQDTT
jgi:hypothetical protein